MLWAIQDLISESILSRSEEMELVVFQQDQMLSKEDFKVASKILYSNLLLIKEQRMREPSELTTCSTLVISLPNRKLNNQIWQQWPQRSDLTIMVVHHLLHLPTLRGTKMDPRNLTSSVRPRMVATRPFFLLPRLLPLPKISTCISDLKDSKSLKINLRKMPNQRLSICQCRGKECWELQASFKQVNMVLSMGRMELQWASSCLRIHKIIWTSMN